MQRFRLAAIAVLLIVVCSSAQSIQHGLRVPDGFEVTEYAGSDLANDIYTLTIDPKGRIIVAGRGYVRILADDDNDGKADRAIQFADTPKDGAMGLLWEGDSLFVTGDGGLRRFRDKNGDGKADGPSELIRRLKTGGEHTAHAIRRGPDGWLYVLCGNHTGIDEKYAQLPTSPIKKPVAGCVIRFTPDLKKTEIVAQGFRNAYDMDFNKEGELFTYDSDNERCVSLPWYEPTRFYHVISGGHYGWLSPQRTETWRMPPYFLDVVPPVVYCNRGSPTGVACYLHHQFPQKYRNGFFLCDWTFGLIYFVQPKPLGASYTGERETFLKAVGDNGFAPTDVAVHPKTGDLYVSIGGRGTRGAVYRIRYPKGLKEAQNKGQIVIQKRSLEWKPGLKKELLKQTASKDVRQRLRALILLCRHRQRFTLPELVQVIEQNHKGTDRQLLEATTRLIATLDQEQWAALSDTLATGNWEFYFVTRGRSEGARPLGPALYVLSSRASAEIRLKAARLVQHLLGSIGSRESKGTVWEGYTPAHRLKDEVKNRNTLAKSFPSHDARLDQELARIFAMIEDNAPETLEKVVGMLSAQSQPSDDVHYLIVTARLRAGRDREITGKVADALLRLDEKVVARKLNRDRHWPTRLMEIHRELAKKDPKLNYALLTHPDFGRPDHVVWTEAPGFDKTKAAERFLERANKDADFEWDARLLRLVARLPAETSLPVLRDLWGKTGHDRVLLGILARNPQPLDRAKFLEAVSQPAMHDARAALQALKKLPEKADADTLLALVQALRRLPSDKSHDKTRKEIVAYLQVLTGRKTLSDKDAWTQWLKKTHSKLAPQLSDGVDWQKWKDRLAKLDWDRGDAERGRQIYVKASCIACHSGARALGPDLRGVTSRFSREDLFATIVNPSKDVSSQYRTVSLSTRKGKTYQGVIIYEAVDSVILQTGPAQTVRLDYKDIETRRTVTTSLMPTGLIDRLKDEDVADLYAFLKTLK